MMGRLDIRELDRPLTERETEVAKLVALGLRDREIAERLDIPEKTMRRHLSAALRKAGCSNRVELARWWIIEVEQPWRENLLLLVRELARCVPARSLDGLRLRYPGLTDMLAGLNRPEVRP